MSEDAYIENEEAIEGVVAEVDAEYDDDVDGDAAVGADASADADGAVKSDASKMLSAGKLYDIILRHPDWRVVEVSQTGPDYCHPLKYCYSDGHLLFQYDGSSRQYHHEAECEDIIDLNGTEPFGDERYDRSVYILQDLFSKEWDWSGDVKQVRKATLDAGAKWIKLHPVN